VLPDAWLFMLGGLFLVVTLFMPKGLAGLFSGWRKFASSKLDAKQIPQAAE
jgi:urea transport system permease protein